MTFLNLKTQRIDLARLDLHGGHRAENSAALEAHLLAMVDEGRVPMLEGFPSGGHLAIARHIPTISDMVVDLGDIVLDCPRWTKDSGIDSTHAMGFGLGCFHPADYARVTWSQLPGLTKDDTAIAQAVYATNPGDLLVIAESCGPTFGASSDHPKKMQYVQVIDDQGTLAYPIKHDIEAGQGAIGTDPTGAWVVKLNRGQHAAIAGLPIDIFTGQPMAPHMVSGVHIANVHYLCDNALTRRTAGFGCKLDGVHGIKSKYGLLANALAHCEVVRLTGVTEIRDIEVKAGSHDTDVHNFNLSRVPLSDPTDDYETALGFGECSSDNRLFNGALHLPAHVDFASGNGQLVKTALSTRDSFEDITITGAPIYSSGIGQDDDSLHTRWEGIDFALDVGPTGHWANLSGGGGDLARCHFAAQAGGVNVYCRSAFKGAAISENTWEHEDRIVHQADPPLAIATLRDNDGLDPS